MWAAQKVMPHTSFYFLGQYQSQQREILGDTNVKYMEFTYKVVKICDRWQHCIGLCKDWDKKYGIVIHVSLLRRMKLISNMSILVAQMWL